MIRGATVFAAMLVLAASGASAKDDDNSQTTEAKKEKKVCKSEKVTGSLTRVRRICMTQSEWDELARRTARDLDELGDQRNRQDTASVSKSYQQF